MKIKRRREASGSAYGVSRTAGGRSRLAIRCRVRNHGFVGESPIKILERWEEHGAVWRIRHLSDGAAIVDLCTCYGEPVDRVESDDPQLIAYLRRSERPTA